MFRVLYLIKMYQADDEWMSNPGEENLSISPH